MLIECGTIVGW